MNFGVDLQGRLGNISLHPSKALNPLFEAISNSIHAIQDAHNGRGRIEIEIQRKGADLLEPAGDVDGFIVRDNGIGFTPANFDSFRKSDSTYKASRGGKGVGRLLWLKAFERAEINSFYVEDGSCFKRVFQFSSPEGVFGGEDVEPCDARSSGTEVTLGPFWPDYRERCPKSAATIASRILEHFALLFVTGVCPQITIADGSDKLSVDEMFSSVLERDAEPAEFELGGHPFTIVHFRNYGSPDPPDHFACFCADGRVVRQERLRRLLAAAPQKKINDVATGRAFYYLALVSGPALDEAKSSERTHFSFEDSDPDLPDVLTIKALAQAAAASMESYLAPHLQPVREESRRRVERFVRSKAPQYLPILKDNALLHQLPPDVSDEAKLDQHLRRLQFRKEEELSERAEALRRRFSSVDDLDEYKGELLSFFAEENDYGKSALARYVVHRKLVIEVLDKLLGRDANGELALEEVIHDIICPTRINSTDREFTKHNLWLVDERLAFHRYLASNKFFRDAETGARHAPDVLIFDVGIAFADADPPSSVVMIEFKRPQRDDYSDRKNPIEQVVEYVARLQENKWEDARGRQLRVSDNTQFYCYLICDLTPSLEREAKKRGWTPTPDNRGYYDYNPNMKIYLELVSYDKLLSDSRKRNQVLFRSLGLE